jgi:preprotein translocase subunit SecE
MARLFSNKTADKPQTKPAVPSRPAKPAVAGPAPRGKVRRYLREVRIEMTKVTWPPRPEVITSTSVVIVAVAIAAAYIGLLDLIWTNVVKLVRLG